MIPLKALAHRVLLADVVTLRIAVAVGAFLFGIGMVTGDVGDTAYIQMKTLMPAWGWTFCLISYGIAKLYLAAQWPEKVHFSFALLVILIGLFLWSYTYFSFLADGRSAAETMMLALIFCEIWIGAHTLAEITRE